MAEPQTDAPASGAPPESIIVRKLAALEGGGRRATLPASLFRELALRIEKTRRPFFRTRIKSSLGQYAVRPLSEVLGALPDPAPIAILSVEGPERPALATVDPALTFHIVDLMLGGDADSPAEPLSRPFTAIDTALAGQAIDMLCEDFMTVLREARPATAATGLRRLSLEQEPAMARIAPDQAQVLTASLTLTLGDAGRTGTMMLILPLTTIDALGAVAPPAPAANDPWAMRMRAAALEVEIEVVAAAWRTEMSVAELSRLDVGQVLPLPIEALGDVSLLVETEDGTADVGCGRLGGHQGHKALKLHAAPDPHFLAPMRRLVDGTD